MKHQEQGVFVTFFTKENRNLDSEIAKVENLKIQKFPPVQFSVLKIIRAFSQRQNTITRAQGNFTKIILMALYSMGLANW